MSWAAHDIEGWESVERAAVMEYVLSMGVDDFIEQLQEQYPILWEKLLMDNALKFLDNATADYMSRKYST